MSSRPFYTNIHLQILAGGFLLNTLLAIVYRYINSGSPIIPWNEWSGFYGQGWPIMLQTFFILYLLHYTIRFFTKQYSSNPNSFQRFLREIPFMLLAGFVVMECFHWVFVTYMVVPESDMDFLQRRLKMILAIDIAFLIVIYAFMTSFRTFRYLQKKNLELLQWQREYAQSQFETAKNQLNPHFLFNSLHALSSLVWIDADKAERFIEKLSRSYRYLLEGRGRELVPLKEELQFHSNLQYLLQERFGDKLQFRQQQPMDSAGMLPPHSMMIVMDYLLANNSMSHAQPLVVEIKNISQHLEIHYSRRPKENSNPQTIEQLQRLQEQYAAQGKPMQIQNINEKALIRLPIF